MDVKIIIAIGLIGASILGIFLSAGALLPFVLPLIMQSIKMLGVPME